MTEKRSQPLVRPLSPYMPYLHSVLRLQSLHTMGLSILHRLTGVALSLGWIVWVYWVWAVATGPNAYARAQIVLATPWMQVLMIGWTFSFSYHVLNGIRHWVWDIGYGFDRKWARRSGYAVLAAALIATAVLYESFTTHAIDRIAASARAST